MKILLVLLLFASSVSRIQAQYSTYKNNYNVKEYRHENTDRYSPAGAAFFAIVPGLGHCYVGEPLRGFSFVGMMAGSSVVTMVGVMLAFTGGDQTPAGFLVFGGAAGIVGSYIWSIADVSRVAKIKNMAFRDKKISFHLQPSIQQFAIENAKASNLIGASIAISF
jgi:hypothetical protein